jgi:hypothetical protein
VVCLMLQSFCLVDTELFLCANTMLVVTGEQMGTFPVLGYTEGKFKGTIVDY